MTDPTKLLHNNPSKNSYVYNMSDCGATINSTVEIRKMFPRMKADDRNISIMGLANSAFS